MGRVSHFTVEVGISRTRQNIPQSAYVALARISAPAETETLARVTRRIVDAVEARSKNYVNLDDELPRIDIAAHKATGGHPD